MTQKLEDNNRRLAELDIIKAIGVFFMIILHVFLWWYLVDDYGTGTITSDFKESFLFLKLIGFFVFMIPITAGASFYFYLKKLGPWLNKRKLISVLSRSLILLLLGYATNAFAWGFDDIISWDILHFVALSFVILSFFSFFPIYYLGAFSLLVIIAAPFLKNLLDNVDSNYLAIILVGNQTGDHYWAFFPWFSFVGFGMFMMHYYDKGFFKNRKSINIAVAISILLIAVSMYIGDFIIKEDLSNLWGPEIFIPPSSRLLANLGMFVILFLILSGLNIKRVRKYSIIDSYSKGILWIYIFHLIIGFKIVNLLKSLGFAEKSFMLLITLAMVIIAYFIGILTIKIKLRSDLKEAI